jgi:hypothetical protein
VTGHGRIGSRLSGGLVALVLAVGCGGARPPTGAPPPPDRVARYPWLAEFRGAPPPVVFLDVYVPDPRGVDRRDTGPGTFGQWLGGLPLRPPSGDGATVVAIDLDPDGPRDGAAASIRLHAEWLWAADRADEAVYRVTTGEPLSWRGWVDGDRFRATGGRLIRGSGLARRADRPSYRAFVKTVAGLTSARALLLDTEPVAAGAPLEPGDLLVDATDPATVAILLDVAGSGSDGRALAVHRSGPHLRLIGTGDRSPRELWRPLPTTGGRTLQVDVDTTLSRATARRFRVR